jgi:1-aminocyclopropane-1-carboxylate deaminase
MMSFIQTPKCRVDRLSLSHKFHTTIDVLRLDLIHPVVSGNKWFKLAPYLEEAKKQNKKILLTFGGAYSNHIVATAAAAKEAKLKSIGLIRGEESPNLSPTLKDALSHGMKLIFLSRTAYSKKSFDLPQEYDPEEIYLINEGGYGKPGATGASAILNTIDAGYYTHIIAATGTGTTLAGLVLAAADHQQVVGIPVLKNKDSIEQEINQLLPEKRKSRFLLIDDYHFGGYARSNEDLFAFMNHWYAQTGIPSDFVYTGKLFYAVNDLVSQNYFPINSRLLVVHSGGLQGNRSLPKGKLIF